MGVRIHRLSDETWPIDSKPSQHVLLHLPPLFLPTGDTVVSSRTQWAWHDCCPSLFVITRPRLRPWGENATFMRENKKVLIKALAACLLDSIWDSSSAYITASICTLVEVRAPFALFQSAAR